MDKNWFRKTTWSKVDADDFYARLGRSRDKEQMLAIQSGTLYSQNQKELDKASLELIQKYFADFPNDDWYMTSMLNRAANIYERKGDVKNAELFFKKAADQEIRIPNFRCDAYLDYSEFVLKNQLKSLYAETEELLGKHEVGIPNPKMSHIPPYTSFNLPVQKYRAYSCLAILHHFKGNKEKARHYKSLAENATNATESGFVKSKTEGLVEQRDKVIDKLLKDIR